MRYRKTAKYYVLKGIGSNEVKMELSKTVINKLAKKETQFLTYTPKGDETFRVKRLNHCTLTYYTENLTH